MKRRVLAIHWNDAASHDAWADAATINDFMVDRCPCVTVGIEVRSDAHAVHIAASVNPGQVGGVWKIPRSMIRRVQVLTRIEVPE